MKRRSEAGQTLAIVAFGMITFLAAAGLAIDMGYLRYEKRLMQSAADSAALAAATDLNLGLLDEATATNDANAVALANGFQPGVNTTVNVTFPVVSPDANNPAVNPTTAAQVTIQQVFPSLFMQASGIYSSTITAAGVATVGTSPGCVYALQTGGPGLALLAGINAPNCGVVDNGACTGCGSITAPSVGVYGVNMAQPAQDPLAYVSQNPPTVSATCAVATPPNYQPGTYCNGLSVSADATFAQGLYIIEGAPLQISAGNVGGTGVTFYITNGGSVNFAGASTVTLTAPTAAEVSSNPSFQNLPADILFFQDKFDNVFADVSENGTGNIILTGTLYFPNAALTIAGSLNPNANTPVVAASITVFNGSVLNVDTTPNPPPPLVALPGGSPLENVSLVE